MNKRKKHIFSEMEVGEVRYIEKDVAKEQSYCHVYGRHVGKKFETITINKRLRVERVS